MKWVIRNHPEHGEFDSREQAVAYAWSMTPAGGRRPRVDAEESAITFPHARDSMRLTLQAFNELGATAEQTALHMRALLASIDSVVPASISIQAVELRKDTYNITVWGGRKEG
jgi:hypothetical protein